MNKKYFENKKEASEFFAKIDVCNEHNWWVEEMVKRSQDLEYIKEPDNNTEKFQLYGDI